MTGSGSTTGFGAFTPESLKPIIDAISGTIDVSNIIAVLAYVATACIALVFMWWGIRKVTKMIMGAFRKGRLSV